jgi:hypothetical protein
MIAIVVLAMWWVFAVFKDKKSKNKPNDNETKEQQD